MQERPKYMIRQIMSFPGKGWNIWMQWPNEVLEKCDVDIRHDMGVNAALNDVNSVEAEVDTRLGALSETQLRCSRMKAGNKKIVQPKNKNDDVNTCE